MGEQNEAVSPLLSKSKTELKETSRNVKQDVIGCILAFISGVIFTVNNVIIQVRKLDFTDIVLVRSILQILLIGGLCYFKNLSLYPKPEKNSTRTKIVMIVQGFLGGLMIIMSFGCVSLMPLGDASTLLFSSPIFTMILACLCLNHGLVPIRVLFIILLMTGTILVVQPPFIFGEETSNSTEYYIGAILGISTAFVDGLVNISINFCTEINPLVLLWWSGIGGLFVSLVAFTFDSKARILTTTVTMISYGDWMAYVGMAIIGLLAYFCMTKSLQMIDPTVVSFIRSLEIVLAFLVQILVMNQIPNYLAVIGALLVLVSVGSIAIQDFLSKKMS